MKYKFHILFLARSGSHMLVDALNHHPKLDVRHQDGGHRGFGPIKGIALTSMGGEPTVDRVIVLSRNPVDRLLSDCTDLPGKHTLVPVEVHRTNARNWPTQQKIHQQNVRCKRLMFDADKYEKRLFLSYEDLTGNVDIREIPEVYARLICEFLEVEYAPMPTRYYKPTVVET